MREIATGVIQTLDHSATSDKLAGLGGESCGTSELCNDGTEPAAFLGNLIFPQAGTMAATPGP